MKKEIVIMIENIEEEYKIRMVDLFLEIEDMGFECKKIILSRIDINIWIGKKDSISILCNYLKDHGCNIIQIKNILNEWGLDVLEKILKSKEN